MKLRKNLKKNFVIKKAFPINIYKKALLSDSNLSYSRNQDIMQKIKQLKRKTKSNFFKEGMNKKGKSIEENNLSKIGVKYTKLINNLKIRECLNYSNQILNTKILNNKNMQSLNNKTTQCPKIFEKLKKNKTYRCPSGKIYNLNKTVKYDKRKNMFLLIKNQLINKGTTPLINEDIKNKFSKYYIDDMKLKMKLIKVNSLTNILQKSSSEKLISNKIQINHLFRERKYNISFRIKEINFDNYSEPIVSNKESNYIKGYAANSYIGLYPTENDSFIDIKFNYDLSSFKNSFFSNISFFGLYDGFYGKDCASFLKENLFDLIIKNNKFFKNIAISIREGYNTAEKIYADLYTNKKVNNSGASSSNLIFTKEFIYIVSLGNSRILLGKNNYEEITQFNVIHDINNETERSQKYIEKIYYGKYNPNKIINNKITVPLCEMIEPGKLIVTRYFGSIKSKKNRDKNDIGLVDPFVDFFRITNDLDFIFIGNNEIFRNLTNNDILSMIKTVFIKKCEHNIKNCAICVHKNCKDVVDLIIKSAQSREAYGNLSCIFILVNRIGEFF